MRLIHLSHIGGISGGPEHSLRRLHASRRLHDAAAAAAGSPVVGPVVVVVVYVVCLESTGWENNKLPE